MKNSLRRIFALALVVMMIAALGMSAFADDSTYDATNAQITFTKTVTKEANAYAPATTFNFTVTPITEGANAGGTVTNPYAGPAGGATISTVAVAPTDDDINETSLEYTGTINLDASKFTKAGVYRYTVAETAGSYAGITYDTTSRNLDVYVQTNADGSLSIAGAVMYAGTDSTTDGETGAVTYNDKGGFTNVYTTADLKVTKTVTGNLGDKSKEFAFTVTITGVEGEQYYIAVFDANGNAKTKVVGEETQALTYTIIAAADGTATQTNIMLKHGESFTVYGLSKDDSYSVTETSYAADGYTTTYVKTVGTTTDASATTSNTVAATAINANVDNVTIAFTNDKTVTVPTGIAMTVLPFVAMLAMAAVVAILFFRKKERREA